MAAVAWFRNPVIEEGSVVEYDPNDHAFGKSEAKRHPAYVYSVNKNACLMHKVARVEIYFYATCGGGKMGRLKQPAMVAITVCGCSRTLTPNRSRTCHVPLPDSILCGRCHGEPATFGKHGKGTKAGIKRAEANVKLGCEVAGYPSALQRDASARRGRSPYRSDGKGSHSMKRFLLIAAALLLTACDDGTRVKSIETTNNPTMPVALLFEKDGVAVYRFADAGHYHYFAVPKTGSYASLFSEWSESCGKGCTRTVTDEVPTLAR